MKRLSLIATAAFGAAIAFSSAPAPAADFSYSTWVVPAETTLAHGMLPFFKKVEQMSGGEFKSKVFTAGQLLDQRGTLNGIRDGVADSGFALEGWAVKEMPHNALTAEFQYSNGDPMAASAANAELAFLRCPACKQEYDRYNVFAMGGHSIDVNYLMCTKDLQPGDDIKALRIRSPLRVHRDIDNWFGATPVFTSFPEMVPALQTGQAHCTIGNTSWMTAYGLKDIIKTVVTTRVLGALPTHQLFMVNKTSWAKLTPNVKKLILDNFPRAMVNATLQNSADGHAGLDAAVAGGVKKVDLGPAFGKKWDEFMAGEPERIYKVAEGIGVKRETAKSMLSEYLTIYKKWDGIVKAANGDRDKLEQALRDEIFSKANL